MHLGHHRHPAARLGVRAGDPLDHPHLPQGPAAIKGMGGNAAAGVRQLDAPAGRRQPDAMQMPVEVEAVVLHPRRMVQIQPAVRQLLPKLRDRRDPHPELFAEPSEAVPARHCRGVHLQDRADVQRL